ncbi:MAG TPA: hypothetical protein VMH04_00080 [Candidatus Solibacter sp.]|nr:hypothetical protein [Candidatus Solibacter sp.]
MTTSKSIQECCTHFKKVGFSASARVRIYGEEFEVLSDPFAMGEGVAVHVRSRKTAVTRILQLPATMVPRAAQHLPRAA